MVINYSSALNLFSAFPPHFPISSQPSVWLITKYNAQDALTTEISQFTRISLHDRVQQKNPSAAPQTTSSQRAWLPGILLKDHSWSSNQGINQDTSDQPSSPPTADKVMENPTQPHNSTNQQLVQAEPTRTGVLGAQPRPPNSAHGSTRYKGCTKGDAHKFRDKTETTGSDSTIINWWVFFTAFGSLYFIISIVIAVIITAQQNDVSANSDFYPSNMNLKISQNSNASNTYEPWGSTEDLYHSVDDLNNHNCSQLYYDDHISDIFNFRFVLLNIRSLPHLYLELEILIDHINPVNFILISETWLNDGRADIEGKIPCRHWTLK